VGFEVTHAYFSALRGYIEEITGAPVHYNWFFRMDPQISESYGRATWVGDKYPRLVNDVQEHKDGLGVHPHGYRWHDADQTWFLNMDDQDWVEYCVRMSLEAYSQVIGSPCAYFRFGNYWLNTATVNLIERLGIQCDLTVEPGMPAPAVRGPVMGWCPDFQRVPRAPYFPAEQDFRKPERPGSRSIRLMPLTSGHFRFGFGFVRTRLRRMLANGMRHRLQDTPLSMWNDWEAPNTFDRMLDRALRVQRRPYLAFAIRSDTCINPVLFSRVESCLRALLAHPSSGNFKFCTPREAMAILDNHG